MLPCKYSNKRGILLCFPGNIVYLCGDKAFLNSMKKLIPFFLATALALVSCNKNNELALPVPEDGYVTVDGTRYKISSVVLYDNFLPEFQSPINQKYQFSIKAEGFKTVLDFQLDPVSVSSGAGTIDLTEIHQAWNFTFKSQNEDLHIGTDAMAGSYFKLKEGTDKIRRPVDLELSAVSGGHRFSLKYSGPTVPEPTLLELYINGKYYERKGGAEGHSYDAGKLSKGIYDLVMESTDGHAVSIHLDAGHDNEYIDLSKLDPYNGQSGKETYRTAVRESATGGWRVLSYGNSPLLLAEPGSFLQVYKAESDGQIIFMYTLRLCNDTYRVASLNYLQPFQPK